MNEYQLDAAVKNCLRETLSDNCVVFKTEDSSCKKIKRFLSACPGTKPKRVKPVKPVIDKPITDEPTTVPSITEESSNQGEPDPTHDPTVDEIVTEKEIKPEGETTAETEVTEVVKSEETRVR